VKGIEMFSVRNVPVVIEPGVKCLESEFSVVDEKLGDRVFPVQLQRVNLDETSIEQLPFIPSTKFPHVFSLLADLNKSSVLVIYDFLGRLSTVYTRNNDHNSWEKNDVAAEHAGKTITQFSVRFNFSTAKDRTKFVELITKAVKEVTNGDTPDMKDVVKALAFLARSRTAPVILPVAVARSQRSNIKL
jgi:hypothetical protein